MKLYHSMIINRPYAEWRTAAEQQARSHAGSSQRAMQTNSNVIANMSYVIILIAMH